MTSLRQVESNRRNALKSTCPKTEDGKQRASRNAVRHGLTAETVIKLFEDSEDYRAFELAVTADYEAATAVERELVLQLASLLWRLRRATSIETGLLQIQGDILRERRLLTQTQFVGGDHVAECGIGLPTSACPNSYDTRPNDPGAESLFNTAAAVDSQLDLARCFLRLANLDSGVFERLGRYEAGLWRQVRQTIFTLEAFRWRGGAGAAEYRPAQARRARGPRTVNGCRL